MLYVFGQGKNLICSSATGLQWQFTSMVHVLVVCMHSNQTCYLLARPIVFARHIVLESSQEPCGCANIRDSHLSSCGRSKSCVFAILLVEEHDWDADDQRER